MKFPAHLGSSTVLRGIWLVIILYYTWAVFSLGLISIQLMLGTTSVPGLTGLAAVGSVLIFFLLYLASGLSVLWLRRWGFWSMGAIIAWGFINSRGNFSVTWFDAGLLASIILYFWLVRTVRHRFTQS